MKSIIKYIIRIFYLAILFVTANIPALGLFYTRSRWLFLVLPCFALVNILPLPEGRKLPKRRLAVCAGGCELLILFLISMAASAVYLLSLIPSSFSGNAALWFGNLFCVVLVEAAVFWNGIIRVYATSAQIGIKWRVIGIICGWIPAANLIALWKIIRTASEEVKFESGKILKNREREQDQICRTRYPILMVHGVFFRDFKYFNYWGRIPNELKQNGAVIYYGNHQSAASVADCGKELAKRILDTVRETGCGKVNIIAHSKGGLDSRYAISLLGMDQYVATLTTVNTPHRGCIFADYLLGKIPVPVKEKVAASYNTALKKLGDQNPDFLAAVSDLTASACSRFNETAPDKPGVYYQSTGSRLNVASGGRFPLNFSHELVKHFDGPNDGLVAESSFRWGERYTLLTTKGRRGISHGDMIDLNRENIRDFDVREFFVGLVSDLKNRGF